MTQKLLKVSLFLTLAVICFFIARQSARAVKDIHNWPVTIAHVESSTVVTDYLAFRKEPCKTLKIKYTYQIANKTYSDRESFDQCLYRSKKNNRDGIYPVDPNFDNKINFYAQGNNFQIKYDPSSPSYNIVDSDYFLKNAPGRTFILFLASGILLFFAFVILFQ